MRSVRTFVIAVVVATLGMAMPVAAAAVRLTLPIGNLPGWHARSVSVQTGRLDLAAGLPHRLVAAIDGALGQSEAASGKHGRLRSDAVVFASASTARRVLSTWGRVRHATTERVGANSYLSARRAQQGSVVAWRNGARIGVIVLKASRAGASGSAAQALRYAVLAGGWLSSPLPATPWAKVLDQIRPDGTVSEHTALEAFAVAYGPLPGFGFP